MFGLLEKMDKFSNERMSEEECIDFMQEIIDNGMVWEMHEKYIQQASEYLAHEKCFDMVLVRKAPDDLEDRYEAARLAGEV
tara:strand:+ start:87 stop:329 length:243 start_codon:yes stop_codon:yes gene_type:complete